MTEYLSLRTRPVASGAVIELTGGLDHHTAPRVRTELSRLDLRPGRQLVLDLAGLTFCDSSGITALIAARNHALAACAAIALAAAPERVSRTFRIVGLEQVFPLHATAQDAEGAWPAAPTAAPNT